MSYAEKCTTSSSAAHVPAGVPSLLKVGEVARVLNVGEGKVKRWLERGALPYVQPTGRKGGRLVRPGSVAEFADSCGLLPCWEEIL